ncbi:hypothetical protein QUF80_14080 [Desulfococcaceae bacterium HSG8]|nr:hypothetical protein [Desulfococcaceae bacterium HSG8]
MRKPILEEGKSYTFSDYFELDNPTKEIVAEFGYQFRLEKINLPKHPFKGSLEKLKKTFYKKLPHISLNSETAKREVLVAPVLLELMDYIEIDIDIEYHLYVSNQLKGNIDYFVRSEISLIVIEAKKADMEKGFSQLAVELIAADKYIEESDAPIYGAVTVGDLWRFGELDRKEKLVSKDIDSYRVPSDLEELFSVLTGILGP